MYRSTKKCFKKNCSFSCIASKLNKKKWSGYSDEDIPGLFPYDYPMLDNYINICDNNTFLFIAVITLCSELEEREAFRKIYLKYHPYVQFHFFVGYTSIACQYLYEEEKKKFLDISQIPISESYINQTLFTLYLHKIFPVICSTAKYYGKMDSDQFIDIPKLVKLIKHNYNKSNFWYTCFTWKMRKLNTDRKYKYSSHNSIKSYYDKMLPKSGIIGYTGSFGIWRGYLSEIIYKEAISEKHIIRMEDQHISWLIYKLNMKNLTNISYYTLRCFESYKLCNVNINTTYGIHNLKGNNLYSFYKHYYKIEYQN